MQPLVSVIVPTKNSAETLRACLESIRNQSYPHIECIVVDNFSSDTTLDIAHTIGVKTIRSGNERSRQRNIGAQHATGSFLLFIDSDMELSNELVAECITTMQAHPEAQAITIPEESFGTSFWAQCKQFERSYYANIPWLQAARFFTREGFQKIEGFDETLIAAEDFDLHTRITTLFGEHSIQQCTQAILHNEGHLTLRSIWKKKMYYGSTLEHYAKKYANKSAFAVQASISKRFRIFFSAPEKILSHPILFTGTCIMKTAEFFAGGLGYLLRNRV